LLQLLLVSLLVVLRVAVGVLLLLVRVVLLARRALLINNLLDLLVRLVRLPVHGLLREFVGRLELPRLSSGRVRILVQLLLELRKFSFLLRVSFKIVALLILNLRVRINLVLVLGVADLFSVVLLLLLEQHLLSLLVQRVLRRIVQKLVELLRVLQVDAHVFDLNVLLVVGRVLLLVLAVEVLAVQVGLLLFGGQVVVLFELLLHLRQVHLLVHLLHIHLLLVVAFALQLVLRVELVLLPVLVGARAGVAVLGVRRGLVASLTLLLRGAGGARRNILVG
jgi:hypothetical protein